MIIESEYNELFAPPLLMDDLENNDLHQIWQKLDYFNWSAPIIEEVLPQLLKLAPSLAPLNRGNWITGLQKLWHGAYDTLDPTNCSSLLKLAEEWCDWPLVLAIGQTLKARNALDIGSAKAVIHASIHQGDVDAASDMTVYYQLASPFDLEFAETYRALQDWRKWRSAVGWVNGLDWGDEELLLEPLANHHLPDFALQYYDPDIAELCCLPEFTSDQHWQAWLNDIYAAGDQLIYAVMHRQWGCVGSVSLILHNGIGYFYYWIGKDFQGQGFGPRAVALMLTMAEQQYGMHTCYAKVYDYNTPSRRALEKLGFDDLGIQALPPDQTEIFYRRGIEQPRHLIIAELHRMLDDMGCGTRPAALLHA